MAVSNFEKSQFVYGHSCDMDVQFQIKIGALEGKRERPTPFELVKDEKLYYSGPMEDCSDLYVTVQVFSFDHPLTLAKQTCYKPFTARWNWNEWLELPLKINEFDRNSMLAFTVWDYKAFGQPYPLGGTALSIFGKYGTMRHGMIDLKLWPCVKGDGQFNTSTPGKPMYDKAEMCTLSKMSNKYVNNNIIKVDWLDRLVFCEIERLNAKQKKESNCLYLNIEFPTTYIHGEPCTTVYYEGDGDEVELIPPQPNMCTISDFEMNMENLVEGKHHKLARSLRSGPADKDLKPSAEDRDLLHKIVKYPSTKALTSFETDKVWKFRYYLSNQKEALSKFIKCVRWDVEEEKNEALKMMQVWAPMNVSDALELLSDSYKVTQIRKYAVSRLQPADDEELMMYLLQLVQALKYEEFSEIDKALKQEESASKIRKQNIAQDMSTLDSCVADSESYIQNPSTDSKDDNGIDLATFLIRRACCNSSLSNYFCWYLKVECDNVSADGKITRMYVAVLKRFSIVLSEGNYACRLRRGAIAGQQLLVDRLAEIVKMVEKESGNRKRKVEKLKQLIKESSSNGFSLLSFDELPLPLDPTVRIKGVDVESATLFKSALMPCRLNFCTSDDKQYIAIFKHGDDLRQDQLVLQIITLMDNLLQKEKLDLKLTPYKVLATSTHHGLVQYIESTSVAEVLNNEGSILNYFRKHSPIESGSGNGIGIAPEVIDNYIKSCAGYCVITYILGIGDRHLDNILLCKSGKMFHIDFGFILGRDPKPMPPPMKLSKEMVEVMGGAQSDHFQEFKKLCYTAFLTLRRSSNLLLNLFGLMVDANVPDIALEPDKTVQKVQDKLRLDLTDEEAVQLMSELIDMSASATVAGLMDQMHKIAQYWRK